MSFVSKVVSVLEGLKLEEKAQGLDLVYKYNSYVVLKLQQYIMKLDGDRDLPVWHFPERQ